MILSISRARLIVLFLGCRRLITELLDFWPLTFIHMSCFRRTFLRSHCISSPHSIPFMTSSPGRGCALLELVGSERIWVMLSIFHEPFLLEWIRLIPELLSPW